MIRWIKRNKEDLLFSWSIIATLVAITGIIFSMIFVGVSEDLVSRVNMEVTEKEEIIYERNVYYSLYDDLLQTYEDVIPKGQYIDDIEYLESVIRELREELDSYNN